MLVKLYFCLKIYFCTFMVLVVNWFVNTINHTPNANMADHSVIARDELHESEARDLGVLF